MKWIEEYRIDQHDMDLNEAVRPSVLLRCMQESSYAQHRSLGPTLEELREQGKAYLLSRISARFYRPVYSYQTLRVETFTTESRGFSFNRAFQIFCEDELIAEAATVWAMVDITSRRPLRVGPEGNYFPPEPALALDVSPRIVFPKQTPLMLIGKHEVTYGETDLNHHMNNTRYVDMLCHYLPIEGMRVSSLSINYLHEAAWREQLSVYCTEQDGHYLFRTVRGDEQTNIEADLTLCPL